MALTADLSGKSALVTGASSGLGAAFARMLAEAGAHLILAARRTAALETLAAEIARAGGSARAIALDVADAASIDALWEEIGAVGIIINNAGVTLTAPLVDQGADAWDQVVGVNARGAWLVARGAARAMIAAGRGGSIVNIASILGLRQAKAVGAYAVSKAAVVQMSKLMALEWARYGIRVNTLCPGYIATELNEDFWETDAGRALIARIPQRRLGQVDDLRGALLLLASDDSRFMTGSEIVVDGGHLVSGL